MSPQPQTQRQHSGKTLLSFHRFPCGTPPSLTEGAGRITQAPRRMSSPPGPQTPRRMSSPPRGPRPPGGCPPPRGRQHDRLPSCFPPVFSISALAPHPPHGSCQKQGAFLASTLSPSRSRSSPDLEHVSPSPQPLQGHTSSG